MVDNIDGVTLQALWDNGWTNEQISNDPKWAALLEKSVENQEIADDEEPTDSLSAASNEIDQAIRVEEEKPKTKIATKLGDDYHVPTHEELKDIVDPDRKTKLSNVPIYTSFKRTSVQVEYVVNATGQRDKIIASNKSLRMMHGRSYMVPIDNLTIDSDSRNIKMFSDVADILDVRFVKNGVACVVPLRHNVTINDGQRLCILSKEVYNL